MSSPVVTEPSTIQVERSLTQPSDCRHIMAHKKYRSSFIGHTRHFSQALFLKGNVPDSKHFNHNHDFWLEMRRNGKRQSQIHSARIMFDRCINEPFHFGKR